MDYLKMGRRIQKRRLEISMTQEKLESLTELSSVFISQIENGARKPSLGSIVKIANAWLSDVVEFEMVPLLNEYWFDEPSKVEQWTKALRGAIRG